jgi:hypothetical protein
MLVGVSLAIRSFSLRYSFSSSMLAEPLGRNIVIATTRNVVVEDVR